MRHKEKIVDMRGYVIHGSVPRVWALPEMMQEASGGGPQPVFLDTQPLSQEEIVPAARSFIDGGVIDWNSENAVKEATRQKYRPTSGYSKLFKNLLNHPGEETEKAFFLLADDLEQFPSDSSIFNSPRLKEFFCKLFVLGLRGRSIILVRKHIDQGEINPQAGRYLETIETKLHSLSDVLKSLEINDLMGYLCFEDLVLQEREVREDILSQPKSNIKINRKYEGPALIEAIDKIEKGNTDFTAEFNTADEFAWKKLTSAAIWDYKTIQKVITLLPSFYPPILPYLTGALGMQVFTSGENESDYNTDWKLLSEGISLLLKFRRIDEIKRLIEIRRDYFKHEEEGLKIECDNFSVPVDYLPDTAIRLLQLIGEREQGERFLNLLESIHKQKLYKKGDESANWLAVLIVLKAKHSEINGFFEKAVEEWKTIPANFREILLNKKPGKLWISREGKISGGESIRGAFPIFTSSCKSLEMVQTPPAADSAGAVIVDFAKPKEIVTKESITVPLFRQTGVVDEEDVHDLIAGIFAKGANGNQTSLSGLAKKWKELYFSRKGSEHSIVFPTRINHNESLLKQAAGLGIEGVCVKGDEVTFILSGHNQLKMAFSAKLLEDGKLDIPGINSSSDKESTMLASIALACAVRPTYIAGSSRETDKAIRAVNGFMSDWNGKRGDLPKIVREGYKEANVAIIIPRFEEAVLVGTKK